jgi:hypothetical protein
MSKEFDTIIIGAGLAGLSVGALLSSEEKSKVLILEKEEYVGGRLVSFVGHKDHLELQGQTLDAKKFKKVMASVYAWVQRSIPDMETIFEQGLLDGFSFEAGGHATFWGNKGRVACLLDYLGKHIELPGNEGFTVIDPETSSLFPMEKGGNMVMGEPEMIPAGDFIRFMRAAVEIGRNLISGSTGIVQKPGFVYIGEQLAEKITESDGSIITGAGVKEVIIENGIITGARADTPDGEKVFTAKNVVCTIPIRKIWPILPKKHFPEDLVTSVEKNFFSVGMLTGFIGLKSNLLADTGFNPKSWLLVPSIIKAEEGFIGDVDIISIMPSNFEPSLAPEGKYSIGFSIALTDGELRDRAKVDRVIDHSRDIFHKTFPQMAADTIWEIWTCSDKGFGDWPPPGTPRPDTTQPGLNGLYFAGDGYGEKTWGSGMDAAIYSALLCANAITGKNYVEKVMPEYHR